MIRKLANKFGFDVIRYPNRRGFEWHLEQVFDHLKIDTVIDVGANHGQFATSLREIGFDGWIYSVEPVKTVFDSLSARMSGDAKWRGLNVALGEADDHKVMNVAGGDAQASSFLQFNEDGPARWGDAHRVSRQEGVEVRRLESVLDEILRDRPAAKIYLKLDTQGLDLSVLKSAGDKFAAIDALQAEIAAHHFYEGMTSFGAAIDAYREMGFEITGVFPLSREFDGLRVIEFDFVFIRNETS